METNWINCFGFYTWHWIERFDVEIKIQIVYRTVEGFYLCNTHFPLNIDLSLKILYILRDKKEYKGES